MPEPTLNETMREYAEEMVKLARKNFRIVSFIVKLFDANDALVPLEPAERKTLRAENLGKEETRALTGVDGTSPLVLGLFPQNVARFQIVLDLENTREARRRFAPRIEGR